MTRILRSQNIDIIGITKNDLDGRVLLACGYIDGEIFPPYFDNKHEAKAREVIRYIEGRDLLFSKNLLFDYSDLIEHFGKKPKVVEVVGGLANLCVPCRISDVLNEEAYAIVDPKFIFTIEPTYPTFHTGRILLQDLNKLMSYFCLIYDGKFIFTKE